jgi:hypothetical protein
MLQSMYVVMFQGTVWVRPNISFCDVTFFADPNGHDPLPDCKYAAELLLSSPEEFKRRVRRHMQEVSLLAHFCHHHISLLPLSSTAPTFPTPAAPEEPGVSNQS